MYLDIGGEYGATQTYDLTLDQITHIRERLAGLHVAEFVSIFSQLVQATHDVVASNQRDSDLGTLP